jgi:hypothetical protein
MGVWGQAPSINLGYYKESKFGIVALRLLDRLNKNFLSGVISHNGQETNLGTAAHDHG